MAVVGNSFFTSVNFIIELIAIVVCIHFKKQNSLAMEQKNSEAAQKLTRPVFLTILCILSFVGIALSLFNYINSYFSYKAMKALYAESFLATGIFELVILAGVLLMWKLKKSGFYIYIIGQVVSLIFPFATGTVETVMGLLTLPVLILAAVFIVLYYRQLRYMS
jgi:hypothetical protein